MADVYVDDVNGVDDDAVNLGGGSERRGTIDWPYLTFDHAMAKARVSTLLAAGDTVWVRSGGTFTTGNGLTYFTSTEHVVGTPSAQITISAYPGETPIIGFRWDCTDAFNYMTFTGLTFDPQGSDRVAGITLGPDSTDSKDYQLGYIIEDCIFQNANSNSAYAIRINRAEDLIIRNCKFDNIRTRIAGLDGKAIYFYTHAINVLIQGNEFIDNSGQNIILENLDLSDTEKEFSGIVIEHNKSYKSYPYVYRDAYGVKYPITPTYREIGPASDISFNNTPAKITSTSTDISGYEAGSTITVDNSGTNNGIRYIVSELSTTNEILLKDNPLTEGPLSTTLTSFEARHCGESGISVKYANDLIIRYNYIANFRETPTSGSQGDQTGAGGMGISGNIDTESWNVYGNMIVDCTRGLQMGDPGNPARDMHGSVVHNNIIVNTRENTDPITEAIQLNQVKNIRCFNNLVYWPQQGASGTNKLLETATATSTVEIKNNIFVGGSGCTSSEGGSTTATMSNNCWHSNVSVASVHEGSDDIIENPQINTQYIAENLNLLNSGVKPLSEFDHYAKTNYGNHIGAVWPKIETIKKRRYD